MKFESKYKTFRSRKCIWKCHLQNGIYFVSASMSQYCSWVLHVRSLCTPNCGFCSSSSTLLKDYYNWDLNENIYNDKFMLIMTSVKLWLPHGANESNSIQFQSNLLVTMSTLTICIPSCLAMTSAAYISNFKLQKTLHTLPTRVKYGMCFVILLWPEKCYDFSVANYQNPSSISLLPGALTGWWEFWVL